MFYFLTIEILSVKLITLEQQVHLKNEKYNFPQLHILYEWYENRQPWSINVCATKKFFFYFWQISQRKTNNKIGSASLFLTVGFSLASTSLWSTWQTINPNSRLISRELAEKLINVCICALVNVSPSISWDYPEAMMCLTNCLYYICMYGFCNFMFFLNPLA